MLKIVWIQITKMNGGFLCYVEEAFIPSPAGAVQLQGHCRIPPRPTCPPAARQAPETDMVKGVREAYFFEKNSNGTPGAVSRAGITLFWFTETEIF